VPAALADLLTLAEPLKAAPPMIREEPHLRALIAAARSGDREAFGDLVTLYQRVVFRTALAALGTREDAEDAAQDAFIMAWHKLSGFRGDSTFRTWLLTIVWRKALDRRRARRLWWSRTQWGASTEDQDPLDHLTSAGLDPERNVLAQAASAQLRRQIRQLTPKLRDTLLLAATGEHSYEEISTMLAIPVGTVKWRVAEARKMLLKRLGA
jgi:RNA polymerase sigma-70 factor (ECF subfamily)